ncbi:MAG TPA: type VI secretion system tube protein Hcp [Planctomycetota bacterium]|jgi:type VI secretion system secreted protein Hcp|nr:type VI secretion system tube protein Hcp [Planctomycetota bacterium]
MAVDMFLKFDPAIAGSATQKDHKDWIEVLSWSWGEAVPTAGGVGGGGRAGKVSMQDFSFQTRTTKASPYLMLNCATGEHFKSVQFDRLRGSGEGLVETTWKLEDVLISSFQISGSEGAESAESWTLNFSKIGFKFQPIDERTGKVVGGPIETKYDLREQKKV